jgi:hypothetical protein
MSTLGERADHLALMNHTALLDAVIGALRDGPNPFQAVRKQGRDYLYVRIDGVADAIARAYASSLPNPVQTRGKDPTCATVHGTPQQERDFAHRVKALDRALADCLARAVAQTGTGADVPRYVAELCTPLSALDVRRVTGRRSSRSSIADEAAPPRLRRSRSSSTSPTGS